MASLQDNLAVRLLLPVVERGDGEHPALSQGDRTWSYAELWSHVGRVAAILRELRVKRGERVAVLMSDSLEAAGAVLSILHAGAVAVPLSELARPDAIRECLQHSGAVVAIVHQTLEPTLDEISAGVHSLRHIVCVGGTERPGVHDLDDWLTAGVQPADPIAVAKSDQSLLLYSKLGVENELRGVPHSHEVPILAYESFARSIVPLEASDCVFSLGRLYSSYGLGTGLFFPLAAGCHSLLLRGRPRSSAILQVFDAFDVTVFCATASVFGQLARDTEEQGGRTLSSCRLAISGAESMPPQLIPRIRDLLGVDVNVGYGLTEAFQFVIAGVASKLPPGSAGRTVAGFETRIIDEHGNPVGTHEIGTLAIRGPTVLPRYWGRDERSDSFHDDWFRTRDRFMVDEDGHYFHCGRTDELFKVGGKWVSPQEIERALMAHEAVWDCAVVDADDEDGLVKPYAFLVPNVGQTAGDELERDLRNYVKNVLAPYKYPRWFEFCERLPKGPTGKVLRYKLKPKLSERRAEPMPRGNTAEIATPDPGDAPSTPDPGDAPSTPTA